MFENALKILEAYRIVPPPTIPILPRVILKHLDRDLAGGSALLQVSESIGQIAGFAGDITKSPESLNNLTGLVVHCGREFFLVELGKFELHRLEVKPRL